MLCRGSARKAVRGSVLGWDQGYKKQMLLKPRSCLITRLINLEHDDLNMALNLEKETTPVVFSVDLISPSKAHAFCLQTGREFYHLRVDSFHYFFSILTVMLANESTYSPVAQSQTQLEAWFPKSWLMFYLFILCWLT